MLHRIVRRSNLEMVHGRMCSGHLQGRLLKMLTLMIAPRVAVELGTFAGYSALCIAEGMAEGPHPDARLITIEANDEYEDIIREHLDASKYGRFIELRIADAMEAMRHMADESADMVFMDADKRAYCDYYEEAMRILRPGGFILADNTLWDGHVVEERKHDAQTAGIIAFNSLVAADPRSEQLILPLRDGLSLIRKILDFSD